MVYLGGAGGIVVVQWLWCFWYSDGVVLVESVRGQVHQRGCVTMLEVHEALVEEAAL